MEKVRERGSGGPERRLAFRDGAGEPCASPAGSPGPDLAVPAGFLCPPQPWCRGLEACPPSSCHAPRGFSPCWVNLGHCGCVRRQNTALGRGGASGRCIFPLPGTTQADSSFCWSPNPTSHCRAASPSLAPNTEPITVAVCPLH